MCTNTHTHTKFPAVVHPTVFQISHRLLLSSHFPCLQMLPAILGCASYYCVIVNAAHVLGCRRERDTFGIWCRLTSVCVWGGHDTHGRGTNTTKHPVVHACAVLDLHDGIFPHADSTSAPPPFWVVTPRNTGRVEAQILNYC